MKETPLNVMNDDTQNEIRTLLYKSIKEKTGFSPQTMEQHFTNLPTSELIRLECAVSTAALKGWADARNLPFGESPIPV